MDNKNLKSGYKKSIGIIAIILCAAVLSLGVYHKVPITALLAVNIVILTVSALLSGISANEVEEGIHDGIRKSVPAVIILMSIGTLIAEWIACGTVPMIIYYGLKIVSPKIVVPATFVLCSVVGMLTGSSWGTAGTIGVACVAMGESMGVPAPVLAGAAISGVLLGDKLSPLSDSTILTSATNDVYLYDHVRSMAYTTIPAFLIALILFSTYSIQYGTSSADPTQIMVILDTLETEFTFNILLLLPIVVIIILSILKLPALFTILASAVTGLLLAVFVQGEGLNQALSAFYNGFVSASGVETVDKILSKGGISSMMSVVATSILALAMGGLLDKAGYLRIVVDSISQRTKTPRRTIAATWFVGVLVVALISNFYVSVVLVGALFKDIYDKQKISRCVLTRTIEEANTITLPLIPWNVSCAYYMGIFGLGGQSFAPYVYFVYANLAVAALYVVFNIFIFKSDEKGKPIWRMR